MYSLKLGVIRLENLYTQTPFDAPADLNIPYEEIWQNVEKSYINLPAWGPKMNGNVNIEKVSTREKKVKLYHQFKEEQRQYFVSYLNFHRGSLNQSDSLQALVLLTLLWFSGVFSDPSGR